MRPKTFNDFFGKVNLKNQLQTYIQSCAVKKETLPHILFHGPSGVGKTSLAMIVANELNTKLRILQAPNLQKISDLLNVFSLINKNDVLFIDEIHALSHQMMEFIFPVMEDFSLDILIGKEFNTKITRMKIPKFTLVGATTQFGKVLGPMEERFGIVINVDYYTNDEIKLIIQKQMEKLNLNLTNQELNLVASHARMTPRLAIRLINRVNDYKTIDNSLSLNEILKRLNIYENGLVEQDIKYLVALKKCKSAGIKSLSIITGIDPITIETKIEPFLLKLDLIEKTHRGRAITNKGLNFVKNCI